MSFAGRVSAKIRRTLNPASEPASSPLPDPMNRRNARSELGGLPDEYFARQLSMIRDRLIAVIRRNPAADLEALLADPEYARIGERVVEYAWIAQRLLKSTRKGRSRLLDVGCVMNNAIVSDVVMECCESIWFMNPSPEPLAYKERVAYLLADSRKHFLAAQEQFARVTCFSTLEHVGMNNLRYGGEDGVVTRDTQHPEEHAKQSIVSLWNLTAPGGELAISVPFGPFEYLYWQGEERPIYYTFDAPRLRNLLSAAPVPAARWNVEIWKVVPGHGWKATTENDMSILPHATQCVGAGAVAIASIRKD